MHPTTQNQPQPVGKYRSVNSQLEKGKQDAQNNNKAQKKLK